jgi:hypothetical protein
MHEAAAPALACLQFNENAVEGDRSVAKPPQIAYSLPLAVATGRDEDYNLCRRVIAREFCFVQREFLGDRPCDAWACA